MCLCRTPDEPLLAQRTQSFPEAGAPPPDPRCWASCRDPSPGSALGSPPSHRLHLRRTPAQVGALPALVPPPLPPTVMNLPDSTPSAACRRNSPRSTSRMRSGLRRLENGALGRAWPPGPTALTKWRSANLHTYPNPSPLPRWGNRSEDLLLADPTQFCPGRRHAQLKHQPPQTPWLWRWPCDPVVTHKT